MSNVFDPPPFPPGAAPTISIPPEVYVYCALAVTVITLVKQYVDVIASLSTSIPKLLVIFYVIGAWGLVYLLIVVADSMLVANEAQIGSFQMIRSSLLLGAVFLVQGPYLLLPPLRKILVERGPLKHIVQGAQRKETRYVALFLFACITAAQGFVAYSLYLVISRVLEIDLAQTLGIVLAYCLVCVFYLYAFLCSMLKRSIKVAGIDPFVHFRANFTYESHGKIVNALETKAFLYLYVFSYIFIALGCFACVIYYFVIDYFAYVARGAAVDVLIIASVFFGLCILTVLCSAVFILNEAFRVVKVTVIVDLSGESDREEEFEAEEEEIAARGAPIEMEERREKAYSDDSKELKRKKSKSKSSMAVHADESVTYASAKPVPQFRVPAAPVPAGGAVMRGGSEPRREEQPSMEYSGDSLDDELEASLSNVPIIPRSTSIASWTPPPPPPISGAQLDRPPSGPPPPPPSRSQIPLPPPPTGGMASQSGSLVRPESLAEIPFADAQIGANGLQELWGDLFSRWLNNIGLGHLPPAVHELSGPHLRDMNRLEIENMGVSFADATQLLLHGFITEYRLGAPPRFLPPPNTMLRWGVHETATWLMQLGDPFNALAGLGWTGPCLASLTPAIIIAMSGGAVSVTDAMRLVGIVQTHLLSEDAPEWTRRWNSNDTILDMLP